MANSLLNLTQGKTTKLIELIGDPLITERLLDMGFHPGVELEYLGRMPLGGPAIIRLESSFLALREEEVQCLKIAL